MTFLLYYILSVVDLWSFENNKTAPIYFDFVIAKDHRGTEKNECSNPYTWTKESPMDGICRCLGFQNKIIVKKKKWASQLEI